MLDVLARCLRNICLVLSLLLLDICMTNMSALRNSVSCMGFVSFDLGSLTRQPLDKHIVFWRPKMNNNR